VRALRQRLCRHEWSTWRPGMMKSFAEIEGDFSDEGQEFDRQTREALGVKGLPGLGISQEEDESWEHRTCMKCGEFELRPRAGVTTASSTDEGAIGPLRSEITLHFEEGENGALEAVVVSSYGDVDYAPFLPAVYLDKILANAKDIPGASLGTLSRACEFFAQAREAWPQQPDAVLSGLVPLREEWSTDPDARIDVQLIESYETERLGATTEFEPLTAMNETVAELGLWALWDWTIQLLSEDGIADTLRRMTAQCAYYQEHGIPGVWELGIAPFVVAHQS
jgi:hypothetical protein